MADQKGLFSSGDYKILSLVIITSDGQSIDVRNITVEINIFEDLFSPVVTGDITLADGADILSSYKLHGNEFLALSIDKPTLNKPYKKIFRLYKISDRKFGTASLQNYMLHFTSEEALLSTQTLVSKSYKGLRIDQMVNDLIANKLKANPDKLSGGIFTPTSGSFDLIIPKMSPLEAIQWLSPRGFTTNQNLFFFFENRDGFNFTSYENLLSLPSYSTYSRSVKVQNQVEQNFNSYNYINVVQDFDIIKSMNMGSFSSTVAVLDLIKRQYSTLNFNAKQVPSTGLLNKNIPANGLQNRLGLALYDVTEAVVKYVPSTDSDPDNNPANLKNWLPQTAVRLGQIHSFKAVITIPGDILIKVGNVINLNIQKMETQTESSGGDDSMRSGRYLISSVHHVFNQDNSATVLELISDSVNTTLTAAAQSSQTVSGAING